MPQRRNIDVEKANPHSPTPIAHAVRGVHFPCTRDDLVDQARQNGVNEDVLEQIELMPEGEYETMADVFAGVGHADRGGGKQGGSWEGERRQRQEEEWEEEEFEEEEE